MTNFFFVTTPNWYFQGISNTDLNISGPLETERQKLETIAKSLGVNVTEKSDDELRKIISGKMGRKNTDESENKV